MKNDAVIGLAYGDEGKGTTVDYLATQHKPAAVIRTGGPQAAHNVVTPDGTHHTFAQYGSATFHGTPTIHSKYMMTDLFALINETEKLLDKTGINFLPSLQISENSLLVTPLHSYITRQKETARGDKKHGSTGRGIAATREYAIKFPETALKAKDFTNPPVFEQKLKALYDYAVNIAPDTNNVETVNYDKLLKSYRALHEDNLINIISDERILETINKNYVIFENSQGILLDEKYGFHPYTTWVDTTTAPAEQLSLEAGVETPNKIGVIRTYGTRHGYGPFPTEFKPEYDWTIHYPEKHNKTGRWQGGWRVGLLDLPLLQYTTIANIGVDEISLTHADIKIRNIINQYDNFNLLQTLNIMNYGSRDQKKQETTTIQTLTGTTQTIHSLTHLVDIIETATHSKVGIISAGPTYRDKIRH